MADQMYECEVKVPFIAPDGVKVLRWTKKPVSGLDDGKEIRCAHCSGAVRIHRQRVAHGPQDHVEHRLRDDSEHCRGGSYFKGVHRTSHAPIL